MINVVCFGEVLWDVFPKHKKIGGAPLNVATRLSAFCNNVAIISAIGNDNLGKQILTYLKDNNINVSHIQVLDAYKTGKVAVLLNEKGHATYKIEYPKAWDKIDYLNTSKDIVKSSDFITSLEIDSLELF